MNKYEEARRAMNEMAKRHLEVDQFTKELFQESSDRIQKQIDDMYLRYANTLGLTRAEMRKQADAMDIMKFQDAARLAVARRDFSEDTNRWLKVYNLKMRASRLELIKAQIDLELLNLYSDLDKNANELFDNEAMLEMERQAGILGHSAKLAPERLKQIVNASFYGNSFSARVWGRNGQYMNTRREVFKILSQIYTDMDGFKKQRRYLEERMNVKRHEAERLIKTEISRINAETTMAMYDENGVTHYQYVAEPNACSICSELDEKIFKNSEKEIGTNFYPMHPNCRCTTIGIMEMVYKDGRSNLDDYRKGG